jgi:putative spermidine/putrescine transport system substrate-binding protein
MASPLPYCLRWLQPLVGALIILMAAGAHADGVLRVLAWPGYADADLVKVFEQRTGSKVEVTIIDSDDVMWQKVTRNQAGDFDVFAVNTSELQRYIKANLVVPVNTKSIPNTAKQLPRFRDLKGISGLVHGGKAYAIPYTYAEMGLIYDRKQLAEAPTSIRALWDPKYKGKVLLYNGGTHNFSLAAQVFGRHHAVPASADTQWPAAVEQLIALRRNAHGLLLPARGVGGAVQVGPCRADVRQLRLATASIAEGGGCGRRLHRRTQGGGAGMAGLLGR